ncbi:hypothetical protein MMC30_003572 [Trapelia coarctata]|nr:hypothetical protein [Trapelia coarctata]
MCKVEIHYGSCGCIVSKHIFRCTDNPLCIIETHKTYLSTLCSTHYDADRTVGAGRPAPGEKRESKLAQTTVVSFKVQLPPAQTQSNPTQPKSKPTQIQPKRTETEPQPKLRVAMEYNDKWKAGKIGLDKDYGEKEGGKGNENGIGNGADYVGKWKGKLDPAAKEFKPVKR